MTNYVKSTNFASKDALATGNPLKIVKGTEIDIEFNDIATAVATKADLNSPTFIGTPAAPTADPGTNTTQLANTAFVQAAVDANNVNTALTGVPTAPTAAVNTNTTQVATTAYVIAQIADDAPTKTGGGASGTWGINISGNAGTVTNGVYTTNFTGSNQTLAQNGFQKLPGGLVMAWCVGPALSSETSTTVTFPYTFSSVYNVQVTTWTPSGPSPDGDFQIVGSIGNSSITVFLNFQAAQGGTAYPMVLVIGV